MEVSHSLKSCTFQPSAIAVDPLHLGVENIENLENHRLVLLDTPGFDDTFRDDVAILKEIANWLEKSLVVLEFYIQ
jgi:predicted GTPase